MLKTSTPWSFIASQQALISITDLGSVTKANSLSGASDRTRRLTFPKGFFCNSQAFMVIFRRGPDVYGNHTVLIRGHITLLGVIPV